MFYAVKMLKGPPVGIHANTPQEARTKAQKIFSPLIKRDEVVDKSLLVDFDEVPVSWSEYFS